MTPETKAQTSNETIEQRFDAAASLAEAFSKLKSGDPVPDANAPEPNQKPTPEASAPTQEAATPEPPKEEDKNVVVPTADAVAKLRGKKSKEPASSEAKLSEESEEMPKEADSLKKWAVNMKKDWKAEKAKREELEAKLVELEKAKNAFDPAEIDHMKRVLEEQERELTLSRVEATREFKEAVAQPLQQIRDLAGQLAKKYELSESEVMSALSEKDPNVRSDKISDVTAGMNDADKWSLYEAQRRFLKVESVREKVTANAKLALDRVEKHRQEQEKTRFEESQKEYAQTLSKIWNEAQDAVPLIKPVEGDDQWNSQIKQAQQFAQELDLSSLNADARARVAIRSAIAPLIYGQFVALFNQYQEMEKALEKYQSATPKAGGGNSAPSGEQKAEFDDFLEAIKANLR
jgi:hypothetical protein